MSHYSIPIANAAIGSVGRKIHMMCKRRSDQAPSPAGAAHPRRASYGL